jgi:hypothetical protein
MKTFKNEEILSYAVFVIYEEVKGRREPIAFKILPLDKPYRKLQSIPSFGRVRYCADEDLKFEVLEGPCEFKNLSFAYHVQVSNKVRCPPEQNFYKNFKFFKGETITLANATVEIT